MHWNGKTWRPLYLPGRRTCLGAVTDYRTGFWTGVGPNFNGRFIVGFAFLHWNGKRYRIVPGFVPNKIGWDTNGFVITAVPRSSRVWVYGSWCPVSRECHGQGVIATLR